jgi:hypothetical protein
MAGAGAGEMEREEEEETGQAREIMSSRREASPAF